MLNISGRKLDIPLLAGVIDVEVGAPEYIEGHLGWQKSTGRVIELYPDAAHVTKLRSGDIIAGELRVRKGETRAYCWFRKEEQPTGVGRGFGEARWLRGFFRYTVGARVPSNPILTP